MQKNKESEKEITPKDEKNKIAKEENIENKEHENQEKHRYILRGRWSMRRLLCRQKSSGQSFLERRSCFQKTRRRCWQKAE